MCKKVTGFAVILLLLAACGAPPQSNIAEGPPEKPFEPMEFGFKLNDYLVKRDTIKYGDRFGAILNRHNIGHGRIFEIAKKTKDSFDIRKLRAGKPYTLLCTKDSLQQPQCFIYQPNAIDYVVINFADSIHAYTESKPVKFLEREASGIITHSLYKTLMEQGLPDRLVADMESIYAWTINFFRLQEGDRFKLIYTEKYINDSISAGINNIRAAYFEHKGEPFYAFEYEADTINHITDYFDDEGKNLRRAFLKAPVQFSKISSRYNLTRRIAYYGYQVRPHKGTDFAAPIGSEILATANGTVVESAYKGGNGNYIKIKHNGTYSTQYLHMRERRVRVGDYVKQGDVIGWVGMTGNTGGPHLCYRFWQNGLQVDPFLEELPEVEPLKDEIKAIFLQYMLPIKEQLDAVPFRGTMEELVTELR
ncbi:MAG: M23 family metallopeptidase [Sinomicrobium sp.]|nr:M23 family metallopeptidase [Sinomicrobium sp.]